MALAPRTVQNIPDCLRRTPITVLQPASITPDPTNKCWSRNLGYRIRSAFSSKYSAWVRISSARLGSATWMEWSEQTSSSILPASRFSRSVAIQRFRFGFVQGEQLADQIPQVLASVKEIDNLNRAGEDRTVSSVTYITWRPSF